MVAWRIGSVPASYSVEAVHCIHKNSFVISQKNYPGEHLIWMVDSSLEPGEVLEIQHQNRILLDRLTEHCASCHDAFDTVRTTKTKKNERSKNFHLGRRLLSFARRRLAPRLFFFSMNLHVYCACGVHRTKEWTFHLNVELCRVLFTSNCYCSTLFICHSLHHFIEPVVVHLNVSFIIHYIDLLFGTGKSTMAYAA